MVNLYNKLPIPNDSFKIFGSLCIDENITNRYLTSNTDKYHWNEHLVYA